MGIRPIEHRLYLPDPIEVPAWFDYASMMIGTSYTYEEFQQQASSERPDQSNDIEPIVGILHEHKHFLQTISMPFLLEWSTTWRRHCTKILNEAGPALHEKGLRATLTREVASLYRDETELMLRPFRETGKLSLGVSHLLEGHATFLEAIVHRGVDGPEAFKRYLSEYCPSPRYRRAYDILRLWCGDQLAFRLFHGIVTASFCFSRPLDVFEQLVHQAAELTPVKCDEFQATLARIWEDALERISHDIEVNSHPEFLRYSYAFISWAKNVDTFDLIVNPLILGKFTTQPTTVYGADDKNESRVWLGSIPPETVEGDTDSSVSFMYEYSVAATSHWLMNQSEFSRSVFAIDDPQYDWLEILSATNHGLEIPVDEWLVHRSGPADRINQDVEAIIDMLSASCGHTNFPSFPVALIRRLWLSFSTERTEEVWEIPEVRSFITILARKIPWMPLLLRFNTPQAMLLVWFGSLAPDAVDGNAINIAHPKVRSELGLLFDSCSALLETDGCDLGPAFDALFHILTARSERP